MKRNIHIITILAVVITMVSVLAKKENKHVSIFSNKGTNPSGNIAPIDSVSPPAVYNTAIYQGYSNFRANKSDEKNNTGNIGITDNTLYDNPKDNVFNIYIENDINENTQFFLEYDLYGVQDFNSVCRGINENISIGGIFVKKSNTWSHQIEKIPTSQLKKGKNKVLFSVQPENEYGYIVKNVRFRVENENNTERQINICQPAERLYYDQYGYISGFVSGKGSDKAKIYANGKLLKTYNSQFEGIVNKTNNKSQRWNAEITAIFEDGQTISKTISYDQPAKFDYKADCREMVPFSETFVKNDSKINLFLNGFALEGDASSVETEQMLTVTGLRAQDMPLLNPDMVNVTAENSGYRCLPHGSKFLKNLEIRIKYDTARIPKGYGPDDIRTFYYDEEMNNWVMLEFDSIDKAKHEIISYTNHFTDFVNSILKTPEAPLTQAYTPTSMKDYKYADPMAGYNIMGAPSANNEGTANMSFPLELPKGRQGMEPQLAITYNSDGGDGWLGVGWNLDIPAITVDTRWGVPHYFTGLESESYLVNGEQITQLDSTEILPLVHRASFRTRNTSSTETIFQLRVEGSFNKIIRHGSTPKTYWWEVIDKQGVKYYYGKYAQETGVNPDLVLKDDNNNIAHWALAEVVDLNGNNIKYYYSVTTQNLGTGTTGKAIYISNITYTGKDNNDGMYKVEFANDPNPDYNISARYGFIEVNNRLLRKITVRYNNEFIRSYIVGYKTGAFEKKLICFIADVTDSLSIDNVSKHTCGLPFTNTYGLKVHSFDYFTEVNNSFSEPESIPIINDAGSGSVIENLVSPAKSSLGKTTSLGWGIGGSLNIGLGSNVCKKNNSLGGNINYSEDYSKTKVVFMDINGDGLPDRVFKDGDNYKYQKLMFTINGLQYSDVIYVSGLSSLGKSVSKSLSWGLEGQVTVVVGSFSHTRTDSYINKYFADVNGDGLCDFINDDKVLINQLNSENNPYFIEESNLDTLTIGGNPCNYILRSGEVNDSVFTPYVDYDTTAKGDTIPEQFYNYSREVVRMWVAPYSGLIDIKNKFRLLEDSSYSRQQSHYVDGVKYVIQYNNNTILFYQKISPSDYSEHEWNQSNISVSKGDKFYFRLQSVIDKKFDDVIWEPEFTYTRVNDVITDTSLNDADGKKIYIFKAKDDLLINDKQKFISPYNGLVRVKGTLNVNPISDSLYFKVKYGNTVWKQVAYASNTSASYSIDDTLSVKADSSLTFSGFTYTDVDWNKLDYDFEVTFLTIDTLTLDTNDYSQKIVIRPMMEFNIFQNIKQVSKPYTFTAGNYMVRAYVVTNTFNSSINGDIYYAVKTGNTIIKKNKISVINGTPFTNYMIASIPAGNVYFEFYCNNEIGDYIDSVYVTTDSTTFRHSGLHCMMPDSLWKFGNLYRGWGQFSYYDNNDTSSIALIDESLLHFSPLAYDTNLIHFDTASMVNFETAQNTLIINGNNDPSHEPFNVMMADRKDMVFKDYAGQGKVGNNYMSNSLKNEPYVTGTENDTIYDSPLIMFSQGEKRRTIRKSTVDINKSFSFGLSYAGYGLSYSENKAKSENVMDYMDMNGDRYPDIVGTKNIQYSTPQGGLFDSPVIDVLDDRISTSCSKGEGYALGVNLPLSNKKNTQKGNEYGGEYKYSGGFGLNEFESRFGLDFDLADINGDGLPDKLYSDGTVSLNKGYSFTAPVNWNLSTLNRGNTTSESLTGSFSMNIGQYSWSFGIGLGQSHNVTTKTLADINGDGLNDFVFIDNGELIINLNKGNCDTIDYIAFTSGNANLHNSYGINGSANIAGSGGFPLFGVLKIVINLQLSGSASGSYENLLLVDFNNDGYPDIVNTDDGSSGIIEVRYNNLGKMNLLKSVITPSNAGYYLDYDFTQCDQRMPQRRRVLASLKVYDGFGNDGQDTTYKKFEYANGYYDRFERTFYGFDTVISKQYNNFNNGTVYRSTIERYHIDDFLFKGLKKYEVILAGEDTNYVETFYKYVKKEIKTGKVVSLDSLMCYGPYYPAISKIDKYFYEGTGIAHIHTQQRYEHGRFGNVSKYSDLGDTTITDDDMIATISYEYDTTQNLLAMADTVIVKNHDNTVLRKRTGEYDNIGQVTQISIFYDNNNASNTDITYDSYGNISSLTLPPNSSNARMEYDYEYDVILNTYPIKIKDNLYYYSEAEYDLRLGQPTKVTDISGNKTRYTYYNDGKPKTITGPKELASGAPYTIRFEYADTLIQPTVLWARTLHYDPCDSNHVNRFKTLTVADGFGRIVQTRKNIVEGGVDKWFVSGKSYYDPYGRILRTTLPISIPITDTSLYYSTPSPNCDSNIYDVLDRILSHKDPDQTLSQCQYGFDNDAFGIKRFKTTIFDPMGKISIKYTDSRGLKTSVYNPENTTTKFVYNAIGELVESTDPEGNKTSYLYDLRGKMTLRDHPDAGSTLYSFDPAGNLLTTQTSNLGQNSKFIHYIYDYNRLGKIIYPENRENNVFYEYGDANAGNQAGRITRMQDASGTQEFYYGNMGEIIQNIHTFVLPNGYNYTFEMDWTYDTWNRLLDLTYPDGEVVTYNYDNGGKLIRVTGNNGYTYNYIDSINYNLYGSRSRIVYGNGTRTIYTYNNLNQQLTNLTSYDAYNNEMQNIFYLYDDAKNITTIANAGEYTSGGLGGEYLYSYTYDDLYRLVYAEGSFETYNNGTLPFKMSMEYSPSGNITNKEVCAILYINGSKQSIAYSNNYSYNKRPHTVSDAGDFSYDWDNNGNMIRRSSEYFDRYLCWDEENRLSTVRDDGKIESPYLSSYIYNAGGERVWKLAGVQQQMWINGQGVVNMVNFDKTLYASPYMVLTDKEYTKHIFIEGERVCSKIGGGFGHAPNDIREPVSYLVVDPEHQAEDLWIMIGRGAECTGFNSKYLYIEDKLRSVKKKIDYEEMRYFYHSDHLGSSSFITNAVGNTIQHLQYLPFGETLVDERTDDPYNTPYKFSGKEKDDETQYSYFGARYYDSDLSVWLSVDPMSDKYYSTSPYMYCVGNPVKLIDPFGMDTANGFRDNSSRKTFNETYSVVNSRVKYYDTKINDKLNRWKAKGYGDEKTNRRYSRSIGRLNESRSEITEVKNAFDEIINSETKFEYVNNDEELGRDKNGETEKLENGNVLINFRTGLNASLIHENRHGYGILIGEGPTTIGTYDYMDEFEAFRHQSIYDPQGFQERLQSSSCWSIQEYVEKKYTTLNSHIIERWEQICR